MTVTTAELDTILQQPHPTPLTIEGPRGKRLRCEVAAPVAGRQRIAPPLERGQRSRDRIDQILVLPRVITGTFLIDPTLEYIDDPDIPGTALLALPSVEGDRGDRRVAEAGIDQPPFPAGVHDQAQVIERRPPRPCRVNASRVIGDVETHLRQYRSECAVDLETPTTTAPFHHFGHAPIGQRRRTQPGEHVEVLERNRHHRRQL